MPINPFTYGKPISDPKRFFGREREVSQIFSRLLNAEFESSSIVGERRIGKTSLLKYLSHPNIRDEHGCDSSNFIFTYVDLQIIDSSTTPTQLWLYLLNQLDHNVQDIETKQILIDIQKGDTVNNFILFDLFTNLDQKNKHVVFLLDEFENVTKNPNFEPEFFYGLRSLASHHNLALITSSRRELIDLTHSEEIRASPFFNIFANINLRLINETDAIKLINDLPKDTVIRFNYEEINYLLDLAGLHPYFLQVACHFLFESYTRNLDTTERLTFLRKEFYEEASPHIQQYWHVSSDQEKIALTIIALIDHKKRYDKRRFNQKNINQSFERSVQAFSSLEKRGLVVATDDGYSLINSFLSEWIIQEFTNTQYDETSYREWLSNNEGKISRLPVKTRKNLEGILPKISNNYRSMLVEWVKDPQFYVALVELINIAIRTTIIH